MKLFMSMAAAALIVASSASVASANSIYGEANIAHTESTTGGELGIGYQLSLGPVNITPIIGAFLFEGDNDRYRSETLSNGREICRDLRNGQFADKQNCNSIAAEAYGKIEATFSVADIVEIGGGGHFTEDDVKPYGTAAFKMLPMVSVKGSVGKDYYSGGLSVKF